MKLIIVRHGETVWNAEGREMGQLDAPLTERGLDQIRRLAGRIGKEPVVRAGFDWLTDASRIVANREILIQYDRYDQHSEVTFGIVELLRVGPEPVLPVRENLLLVEKFARVARTTQKRWPVGASITHQRFTKPMRFAPKPSSRRTSASRSSLSMSRWMRLGCVTCWTSSKGSSERARSSR